MEALILYSHPSGDNSEVLCALLRERGCVSLFARSSRGSSSNTSSPKPRRANHKHHPEPFDYGRIFFKERRSGMPVVTDFIPETSFPALRLDIDKLTCASLLCEACSRLVPEHCPGSEAFFDLAILGLRAIAESAASPQSAEILKSLHLTLYGLASEAGIISPNTSYPLIQPQSVGDYQPAYATEPVLSEVDTNAMPTLNTPTPRNLLFIINAIEHYTQQKLRTRLSVENCIKQIKRQQQ
jgi:hypothetical protein